MLLRQVRVCVGVMYVGVRYCSGTALYAAPSSEGVCGVWGVMCVGMGVRCCSGTALYAALRQVRVCVGVQGVSSGAAVYMYMYVRFV